MHTVLMLTQGTSPFLGGSEGKIFITLDPDLYCRTFQTQQSVGNTNWVMRTGTLHMAFAVLHALSKTIYGSAINTSTNESGTYTSAALHEIFGGKEHKRDVKFQLGNHDCTWTVNAKWAAFRKGLHVVQIDDDIQPWFSESLKQNQEGDVRGELVHFFTQYLEEVEKLLKFISS